MTEITNYRCDICGEVYIDQESAERCEAFHVRPNILQGMSFGSIVKTKIPYPAFLLMTMEDNAVVKYAYNEIVNVAHEEEPGDSDDDPVDPNDGGSDEPPIDNGDDNNDGGDDNNGEGGGDG